MAKRNWVKDFLESSPWALGAVAFAAVASFLLSGIEQGLRIYDRMRADPNVPSLEVADLRGFLLVVTTESMREVRAVREALGASKTFSKIFAKAPPASNRVAVWPVQVLILNPASDRLNLHSCRMSIRMPGVKWAISTDYFVSDSPVVDAKTASQPIQVEGKEAKRVQLMFVFGALEQMAAVVPKQPAKPFDAFEHNSFADITCRDQARRELRTTSTLWGSVLPERDSEGKRVVYRTLDPAWLKPASK